MFNYFKNILKKNIEYSREYKIRAEFSNLSTIDKKFVDVLNESKQFLMRRKIDTLNYSYSKSSQIPLLYSTVYSVLLGDLLGLSNEINNNEKEQIIRYFDSFQCEDGLFRDKQLQSEKAELIDWWGWRHLAGHIITAYTILGSKPKGNFKFLEKFFDKDALINYLDSLNWQTEASNASNTVMNIGVLLQYERDFFNNIKAGETIKYLYEWLNKNQDSETGLWGKVDCNDRKSLSEGIQTAYHIWILYFYDNLKINYLEKGIDACLKLQNELGGFGFKINSSACEDIDAIDPLCRFYLLTDYRKNDIENVLKKSIKWILFNHIEDDGFVFRRKEKFIYGHQLMKTESDESSLFSSWFRLLSLVYLSKVLKIEFFNGYEYIFPRCPGYQFWFN